MMQKSSTFTTIFRVKKCYFHYDFACKKVSLSLRYANKIIKNLNFTKQPFDDPINTKSEKYKNPNRVTNVLYSCWFFKIRVNPKTLFTKSIGEFCNSEPPPTVGL
jgi:hypothetical protein